MNEKIISQLCIKCLEESPQSIERCAVGQGNYVFIVACVGDKYVIRCSAEQNAYKDTIYWLGQLASIEIPVPRIIAQGRFEEYEYLILSYFEGKDIGLVYEQLTDNDKKEIAKEIAAIQNKVAKLKLENIEPNWSWRAEVEYTLERARERITKNLLIHNGRISGIVDIDWMGIGDKLTYVALTNMALLNMEYDTDYVAYILDEMQISDIEKEAFLFYTLMYCVDFMGERGMQFMDKTIEVNEQIIDRLNRIYDQLFYRFFRKDN